MRRPIIAVIGPGTAEKKELHTAEEAGRLIARRGAILVCGGLSGVMEAAARGAKEAGGTTVGILPQNHCNEANPYIDVPVATGFGEGRNVVIVRTADALIAVGGEYGTLSEISFALKTGKPVIGIHTWNIRGIIRAEDAEDAVSKAFALLQGP
ncbi:MAG: TIGR00725 family protein [Alphaproteobacteria bacterium]|uniref:TIGR00725 family protein n=1 Tax=Candidatus Nitrobium versatile TaxID=2884831 RepID=A0A953J8W4_9BACT|nr:TIGR00725 family protein [Candidatus Nitrobium versatile]